MQTYHVENFGCRANQADGDAIGRQLEGFGLRPSDSGADVVVVNTCSVTAEAEKTARAYLRKAHRVHPGARVVVTGCYAQRAADELAECSGADAVVGNSHKGLAAAVALGNFVPSASLGPVWKDDFAHAELGRLPLIGITSEAGRTRPTLKVQDGCSNRCSFCIIPLTRGSSRSVTLEECVEAAESFAADGGQELVLSGINLGRWGRDLEPGSRLPLLVRALIERTSLPRLRLSSVEPMDWTEEMLGLFAEFAQGPQPRLARHFHVPLQSGADTILRAMHRRYRPWHYARKLEAMRALAPQAAIGADVMVGFPGETEALFRESYDFIAQQPLTYLHLFPFSPRPGTPAACLRPVPAVVIGERMSALRRLIAAKAGAFRGGLPGQQLSAVTLAGGEALTDNFLPLRLEEPAACPANRMVSARILRVDAAAADAPGVLVGALL